MGTRRAGPNGDGQLVPDRLLRVDEAAAMLGLTPATLYQWAYERRIPVVKPGGPRGPLRFRLSTLQRLIAEWERPALGASRPERP
jgi:excisionase family DNA binding protein